MSIVNVFLSIYRLYARTASRQLSSRGSLEHQKARIRHISPCRGAPRGDLRTPSERAGENNVFHRGRIFCARRNHLLRSLLSTAPDFPSGLAVRRVGCECVIQAIKDQKLNTNQPPPELNFQILHFKSGPRFFFTILSDQSENKHTKLGGQQIHSSTHMHYEHGKLCLGRLSCTPLQRRPVSAIDR
jgi:hypothetical protein